MRRRSEKTRRHELAKPTSAAVEVVREATRVERLAYTRTQAAAALGVSRSTFDRRVLPFVETIEMPWGTQLIPLDELQRLVAERRRPARAKRRTEAPVGRPPVVAADVVERIRDGHSAGQSFAAIARGLEADRVPTAHGGARWWPSTVRSILLRHETDPGDVRPAALGGRRGAK
jgi:Recombinase